MMVRMNDTFTSSASLELNNLSSMPEFLKSASNEEEDRRDSIYIVLPITIIYIAIFFTGLIGNVSTCVVISRNKSMHTATNYYLFSLAVSDLLLLISGLPPEMYYIWNHYPYPFGEIFCVVQSFAAETSANATVLTITAFTVERLVELIIHFEKLDIIRAYRKKLDTYLNLIFPLSKVSYKNVFSPTKTSKEI